MCLRSSGWLFYPPPPKQVQATWVRSWCNMIKCLRVKFRRFELNLYTQDIPPVLCLFTSNNCFGCCCCCCCTVAHNWVIIILFSLSKASLLSYMLGFVWVSGILYINLFLKSSIQLSSVSVIPRGYSLHFPYTGQLEPLPSNSVCTDTGLL